MDDHTDMSCRLTVKPLARPQIRSRHFLKAERAELEKQICTSGEDSASQHVALAHRLCG